MGLLLQNRWRTNERKSCSWVMTAADANLGRNTLLVSRQKRGERQQLFLDPPLTNFQKCFRELHPEIAAKEVLRTNWCRRARVSHKISCGTSSAVNSRQEYREQHKFKNCKIKVTMPSACVLLLLTVCTAHCSPKNNERLRRCFGSKYLKPKQHSQKNFSGNSIRLRATRAKTWRPIL